MRDATRKQIEALHRQIADLIEAEKAHHDEANPHQQGVLREISHCKIEWCRYPPDYRARAVTGEQR